MRLIVLLATFLLPLSTFAQPPLPLDADGSITVLRPAPGISQLYDQLGNSATVYEVNQGMQWYSQQDRYDRIQSQGYLFDPIGTPPPLRVPDSMRYLPSNTQEPMR